MVYVIQVYWQLASTTLNSTCFGQFLCPSSGVFHCTHSNGICRTGLLTACEQDVPSWACSKAVSKPVWHIPLLCLQCKTPDDGQRNCPKHVEFCSQNKFEKLVPLVDFITRRPFLCLYLYSKKWQSAESFCALYGFWGRQQHPVSFSMAADEGSTFLLQPFWIRLHCGFFPRCESIIGYAILKRIGSWKDDQIYH